MSPTRITLLVGVLGAVALAAGGVLALQRTAHGLDLALEARASSGDFPIHHGFEPRPFFHNRHRLNSVVVQKWNFHAHPIPTARVPYRATLTGTIEVPAGERWALRTRPSRGTALSVESDADELDPGTHPLTLVLVARFPDEASVVLEYRDAARPGTGFARVPVSAVRPARQRSSRSSGLLSATSAAQAST